MTHRTAEEYVLLVDRVTMAASAFSALAQTVSDDDLAAALATVERAFAVGPVFHPSEWMKAQADNRLEHQRRLLTAFRDFRSTLRSLGMVP